MAKYPDQVNKNTPTEHLVIIGVVIYAVPWIILKVYFEFTCYWGQTVAAIFYLGESSPLTTRWTLHMICAEFDLIKCKLWKSFAIFSISVAIQALPQPTLPPSPPFVLFSSNRFSPATHNSLFSSPFPQSPLLVQCPLSTGAFEQFEIKANNG